MRHTGWRRGSHLNLIDASTRVPERWFVSPCAATTKSADRSDCLCGALRGLLDDRKIDPLCRNGLQRVLRMGNGFAHKRQNFSNLVPLWRTVRHCGGSLDAVRRITSALVESKRRILLLVILGPVRLLLDSIWCPGRDSNPHGRRARRILSPVRMPVPPPGQLSWICSQEIAG